MLSGQVITHIRLMSKMLTIN